MVKFNASKRFMDIKENLKLRLSLLEKIGDINLEHIVNSIKETLERGNSIFWCGNGGSASQADHLSAELLGRFKKNRAPYSSYSLIPNSSLITCISNDFGYEKIFSRQLEVLARKDDLCVLLSTSGKSPNVTEAYNVCKAKGIKTLLFLGNSVDYLYDDSEMIISIPSDQTDLIQECHLILGHIICDKLDNLIK